MMKPFYLLFLLSLAIVSCNSDDNNEPMAMEEEQEDPPINKVALLQVDFLTNTFEGGKELEFDGNPNFTISHEYFPPSDFGFVKLFYEELDQLLFEGTIIWLGRGERSYPDTLDPNSNFPIENEELPFPPEENFEIVSYGDSYPDVIPYNLIWEAIDDLALVKDYRELNPTAKINLFFYTPSVGEGDPADWDWIVILKN